MIIFSGYNKTLNVEFIILIWSLTNPINCNCLAECKVHCQMSQFDFILITFSTVFFLRQLITSDDDDAITNNIQILL